MKLQYISYIWPLMCSAFMTLSLSIYSIIKQKNTKCFKSFIASMLLVTIWSSCNAMEMASVDFFAKLFWANIQYIAYCFSPVSLLALCMQFTGYDTLIHNKKFIWFAVVPTIILVLVWTDSLHGLVRYDFIMDYSGEFPVISKKYGPLFWVHAAYSHSLNIYAWILLIRAVFLKNTVYRRQAFALLFGVSLIMFPNIAYVLGLSPFKQFDITPVFFGPAGIIVYWAIFRYKLFDLVPIARATVIESMDTGIVIVDLQNRVLDINPAFKEIADLTDSIVYAKTIEDVCKNIPEAVMACTASASAQNEFSIIKSGISKAYEVLVSPIVNANGINIGRLIMIRDITEKKQIRLDQLNHQRELAVAEERENLARDLHDNLGQVLGFINFQTQAVKQELLNADIQIGINALDKLVSITQSTHQEIRDYIRYARNAVSVDKNFITLLIKEIKKFEELTSLKVKLDFHNDFFEEELQSTEMMTILYILREALNNITKHAAANHVKMAFSFINNELYASVEDDGKGFNINEINNAEISKFGLNIMRGRTLEIGGHINIQSALGKGTRIEVYIPIKEGIGINEDKAIIGR